MENYLDPDIVNSPLYAPIPQGKLHQVRRLAYDLAWGALQGLWSTSKLSFSKEITSYQVEHLNPESKFTRYLIICWYRKQVKPPDLDLLKVLGYVDNFNNLTEKAFLLLDEPSPQSVFISYRRNVSSAFALYIWSSLQAAKYNVFIDIRNILPGDGWHALLEKRVKESTTFICVLGKDVFEENGVFRLIESTDSFFVQQEINWALENSTSRRIIPVLHGGLSATDLERCSEPFSNLLYHNLITINEDTAPFFHEAVETILFTLSES